MTLNDAAMIADGLTVTAEMQLRAIQFRNDLAQIES
jgi:hypothetical protein